MLRALYLAASLALAAAMGAALAQDAVPPFPELTGPVVDQANLLSAGARDALTRKLRAYDDSSGNQLVVVTVDTLNGYPIEDYGYQLGRHWGIGQKGSNTGAVLIVDKDEHQLRIEVGYGLEGTLTDAQSDNIIRNIIVPHLKQNDYDGGITAGVDAILTVLGGQDLQQHQTRDHSSVLLLMLVVVFILLRLFTSGFFFPGGFYRRGGWGGWGGGLGGGFGGGGFGGGGFGGGGFSGGGGSFGGGGASGRW
jgi:uncharacterized protein